MIASESLRKACLAFAVLIAVLVAGAAINRAEASAARCPCSNTFCSDPFSCASCTWHAGWSCMCSGPDECLVSQCGGKC